MAKFNVNNLLIKPTYDVSFYGENLHLPLGIKNLGNRTITWSGIDELLVVDSDIDNYSRVISNSDSLHFMNEADGVAFDNTWNWLSDMSAWVYKFNLTVAATLDVTAWTSGDHAVTSVRMILTERLKDGTLVRTLVDEEKLTGMTVANGAKTNVAIVTFEGNEPFKIGQGNTLRLQLILGRIDTLVATSFEGILPLFYFQEGSTTRQLVESTLNLQLYPALDHAFVVFRDQSLQEGLDYSGTTEQGEKRN